MTRANPLLEVLLAAERGELPADAYVFCANPEAMRFIRQWRTAALWMPREQGLPSRRLAPCCTSQRSSNR